MEPHMFEIYFHHLKHWFHQIQVKVTNSQLWIQEITCSSLFYEDLDIKKNRFADWIKVLYCC
jgi:hypothetical protein